MTADSDIDVWVQEARQFGLARRPLFMLRDAHFHDASEGEVRELLTSLALSHGMTISFSDTLSLSGQAEEWAVLMWSRGP